MTLEQLLARDRALFWQSFAIIMTINGALFLAAYIGGLFP